MKIFRREDAKTTRWSGGTTTELAIYPEGAVYADRRFLWRISTAVVEDEESTFTALPDYHRFLGVREGELRLCHGEEPWFTLYPAAKSAGDADYPAAKSAGDVDYPASEPANDADISTVHTDRLTIDSFDGGIATLSRGRVTDMNLMVRKGQIDGDMSTVQLAEECTGIRLTGLPAFRNILNSDTKAEEMVSGIQDSDAKAEEMVSGAQDSDTKAEEKVSGIPDSDAKAEEKSDNIPAHGTTEFAIFLSRGNDARLEAADGTSCTLRAGDLILIQGLEEAEKLLLTAPAGAHIFCFRMSSVS